MTALPLVEPPMLLVLKHHFYVQHAKKISKLLQPMMIQSLIRQVLKLAQIFMMLIHYNVETSM
jgi:hypothetical protein